MATRLAFALVFVVVGLGITFATIAYTSGRNSMASYELLIPGFGGALPGIVLFWLVSRWQKSRSHPSAP